MPNKPQPTKRKQREKLRRKKLPPMLPPLLLPMPQLLTRPKRKDSPKSLDRKKKLDLLLRQRKLRTKSLLLKNSPPKLKLLKNKLKKKLKK